MAMEARHEGRDDTNNKEQKKKECLLLAVEKGVIEVKLPAASECIHSTPATRANVVLMLL